MTRLDYPYEQLPIGSNSRTGTGVSESHERRNRDFDEWGRPRGPAPSPAIARRNTLLAMCCFPPLWPFVALVVAGDIISRTIGDKDAHQ